MRKMKRTDLDWIEQVPFDWEVKKLKYCFTFGKGLSITKDNLEESGVPVISYGQIHSKLNSGTSVNDSLIRYVNESYLRTDMSSLVKKNDFIFADTSEDLEGCGNCIYNDFDGNLFAGYHTIIFRSRQKNAKYFAYLFLTDCWRSQIRKVASGVKLYSITQKILKETSIIIPPLTEQKKIADFLDAKCADIDQIRADIEKQIEILTDYKKSVITEAVTKGLDPKAKTKDSGIEWIGKIPEHWGVDKLKYHLKFRGTKNPGDTIVLSLYRELGIVPKDSRDDNHNKTSEDTSNYRFVRKGDFVINKMKAWQGSVAVSNYEGIVSPAYFVYGFCDDLLFKRYFHYLLRDKSYATEFKRLSGGIRVGQWDLPRESLENTLILLPPILEQKAIADYLDEKCSEIDATIAEKQKQLETLEEYKKSLIFEYVSGKKEVV